MLNGGRTIIALNGRVSLYTTIRPKELHAISEAPTLSSLYASASTLLAKSVTTSASCFPPLLFELALLLD